MLHISRALEVQRVLDLQPENIHDKSVLRCFLDSVFTDRNRHVSYHSFRSAMTGEDLLATFSPRLEGGFEDANQTQRAP